MSEHASAPTTTGEDTGTVHHRREGAVLELTLSNPGRRNALSWGMYEALRDHLGAVNDDPEVRVVVLRGADGAFAAGTDIQQFQAFHAAADGIGYERFIGDVLDVVLAVRVPIVGVVEGPAVGGGLLLAACCDVLVAADDARFGIPIARTLGNIIAPAGLRRLRDRLGPARTMSMLMTAELLDAQTAAAAGFVHAVAPAGELEATAGRLIERIAGGAPLTLAGLKELERRVSAVDDDLAEDVLAGVYGSEDFREGVAAFVAHRKPQWRGR